MTHEYTILVGGVVERPSAAGSEPATAIAYAGGVVLAIGSDDVQAISRGDSIVCELRGRHLISLAAASRLAWPPACDPNAIDRLATLAVRDDPFEELDVGAPADFAVCSEGGCLDAIVVGGVLAWGRLGP